LKFPSHGDGDVIVAAGNIQKREVVGMNNELYAGVGFLVIWCVKYILVPIGVIVFASLIVNRLLQTQPDKQKNKRN
jgi:hypothetical protein